MALIVATSTAGWFHSSDIEGNVAIDSWAMMSQLFLDGDERVNEGAFSVPPGFSVTGIGGPFVGLNGPIYVNADKTSLGFCVESRHCNPIGRCHGGWLATLLDIQLSFQARRHPSFGEGFPVSVNLSIDYIDSVGPGAWIEATSTVLKVTGRLVFSQALAFSADRVLARASGVFRVVQSDRFPPNAAGNVNMAAKV